MIDNISKKGKIIVIEGTDGSGKATQIELLQKYLTNKGYHVEVADFPQYGKPSSYFVEKYLRGEYGSAEAVGPYQASLFYALDRYDKSFEMVNWLQEGKIILCNRYTTANKGHQAGKIKNKTSINHFLKWLDDLEFRMLKIPKPDKIILLYLPCEIGQKLVDKKGYRQYIGKRKKDIHEADLTHLQDAEKAYLYVARKEKWDIVNCSDQDHIATRQSIHQKIIKIVNSIL